jgi:hypothetical protein
MMEEVLEEVYEDSNVQPFCKTVMLKLMSALQLDLHVIKAEPDSDHDVWPVSSVNDDMKMEEEPIVFTFVSVNGEVSVGVMSGVVKSSWE